MSSKPRKRAYSEYICDEALKANSKEDAMLVEGLDCMNADKVLAALKAGANVNYRDKWGYTPLQHVITRSAEIVRLLLEYGADVDAQNSKGDTALHIAVLNSALDCVHMLLYYNANANMVDMRDCTPFMVSLTRCTEEMQRVLLPYEADFNRVDKYGRSVLMLAMERSSYLTVELIERGAIYCTRHASTAEELRSAESFSEVWYYIDITSLNYPVFDPMAIVSRKPLVELMEYSAETNQLPDLLEDVRNKSERRMQAPATDNTDLIAWLLQTFDPLTACKLAYVFTSYGGYNPTYMDAEWIFSLFGRSEFYHFVTQLHLVPSDMNRNYLLPVVMFDMNSTINHHVKMFIQNEVTSLSSIYRNLPSILQFFRGSCYSQMLDRYVECGGECDPEYIRLAGMEEALKQRIPSLLQLCRDVIRDRICEERFITTFPSYREYVYWQCAYGLCHRLPDNIYKILTFQKPLY